MRQIVIYTITVLVLLHSQTLALSTPPLASFSSSSSASSSAAVPVRTFAWMYDLSFGVDNYQQSLAQLTNRTWSSLLDGVYVLCAGVSWLPLNAQNFTVTLTVDTATYAAGNCSQLQQVVRAVGLEFHVWVQGRVPLGTNTAVAPAVKSILLLAQQYGWDGINVDDESECAPRANTNDLVVWSRWLGSVKQQIQQALPSFALTADVQAIFGITNTSYVPNAPCLQVPWDYTVDPAVVAALAAANLTRWIEMDTYYFTLSRFLDALDWYTSAFSAAGASLGVGLLIRDDLDEDEWIARFYALQMQYKLRGFAELDLFRFPLIDAWLPWLSRFRSLCASCSLLSCYEPSVNC